MLMSTDYLCKEKVTVRWHPYYYRCYTFQGPPADAGLKAFTAIIYLNTSYSTIDIPSKMDTVISLTSGIRMFYQREGTYPIVLQGIDMSPGYALTMQFDQTLINRLSEPYSSCVSSTSPLDPSDPHSYPYSFHACKSLCRQQQFMDMCGCAVTFEEYLWSKLAAVNNTFCPGNIMQDTNENILQVLNGSLCEYVSQDFVSMSVCDCPNPCSSSISPAYMVTTKWPDASDHLAFYQKYIAPNKNIYGNKFDAYQRLLDRQVNLTTNQILSQVDEIGLISKNFLQVELEFVSEYVPLRTDNPVITWDTLFGNIGGTLNLWMGITVLFAAELLELAFNVIYQQQ